MRKALFILALSFFLFAVLFFGVPIAINIALDNYSSVIEANARNANVLTMDGRVNIASFLWWQIFGYPYYKVSITLFWHILMIVIAVSAIVWTTIGFGWSKLINYLLEPVRGR